MGEWQLQKKLLPGDWSEIKMCCQKAFVSRRINYTQMLFHKPATIIGGLDLTLDSAAQTK